MMRLLSLLCLASLIVSCERDVTYVGNSLEDQLGPFDVISELGVNKPDIDFASGETSFFTAEFSKAVDWEITITGITSNAVKKITGNSRELYIENALWDGSTTQFPMFKPENCIAELRVSYSEISGDSTITVDNALIGKVNLAVSSVKTNEGIVIADFEFGPDASWDLFLQGGSMTVVGGSESPQGNSYYNMSGDCSWDWLIGMATIPLDNIELSDNENEVYFNALLNFPDDVVNPPIVLFDFREDDNQDGAFTEGAEDAYAVEIKDIESGWQLITIKYSDLQALVNGLPVEAAGNDVLEPHNLHSMRMLFLAPQGNGYSEAHMDFMIFTEGKPLNP
jgi:hypothetical protein